MLRRDHGASRTRSSRANRTSAYVDANGIAPAHDQVETLKRSALWWCSVTSRPGDRLIVGPLQSSRCRRYAVPRNRLHRRRRAKLACGPFTTLIEQPRARGRDRHRDDHHYHQRRAIPTIAPPAIIALRRSSYDVGALLVVLRQPSADHRRRANNPAMRRCRCKFRCSRPHLLWLVQATIVLKIAVGFPARDVINRRLNVKVRSAVIRHRQCRHICHASVGQLNSFGFTPADVECHPCAEIWSLRRRALAPSPLQSKIRHSRSSIPHHNIVLRLQRRQSSASEDAPESQLGHAVFRRQPMAIGKPAPPAHRRARIPPT